MKPKNTILIDKLQADQNIDPERIYANGLSNGGGMSFVLSCTLSDRIAAVGDGRVSANAAVELVYRPSIGSDAWRITLLDRAARPGAVHAHDSRMHHPIAADSHTTRRSQEHGE